MVLSNKKLKQKLRAVKAELITDSGGQNNFADKKFEKSQDVGSKTSESLRTILNLEAQRSKSSKRERPKRVKQSAITLTENAVIVKKEEISGDVEQKVQDGPNADNMQQGEKKKKMKKRKRDESETSDNVKKVRRDGSEASENMKKRKKKKRPRQWWMIKKRKNDKNNIEVVENGTVKEEGVIQNESGSTGEQLVAKADESIENDRKEISPKVYVGGIPYYSTEDDIRSFFEGCGTITFIDCMTFPDTGKFRGIAIITFKTEAAAKRALALDGSDMGGLFLKVQPFKSASKNKLPNFAPSVAEGYNRIYVGNLSWDITEDDLRNILVGCTIKSIRFGEDKETGEFKGYAHVDFADSASLNTSLKLDQTLVCGRPIRVSCAVLKNATTSTAKPTPKYNQSDTGKEVTAARIKAPPQENQVYEDHVTVAVGNQVTSSETNAVSAKIRRRTCYECGERGHLSSACPKIQAADPTNQEILVDRAKEVKAASLNMLPEDNQFYSYNNYHGAVENQVTSSETNAVSSKIRRRTCYECGEKGHLSSDCPKIQAADPTKPDNQVLRGKEVTAFSFKEYNYNQVDTYNVSAAVENQAPSSETNATSSKIRRRTCYECGEKGHLSSACPKIQSASKPDNQVDSGKEFTPVSLTATREDYHVNTYNVSVAVENQAPNSETNAISSKIRRRTCYECGEKGHLSSACPKAQAAVPTNPGTT